MTAAAAIAFTLAVVAALLVFILLPTVAYSSTATATSCAATPARTDNYTAPWPAGHAYHSDTHAVSKPYNLSLPPRGRSWQTCVRWPTNIIPFDEMSGWRFSRWKRRHIGPHGAEAFLGHEGNNAVVPQRNGGCLEYMPRWGDSDRGSGSLHKTLAVLSRLTRPGDIALEIGTFMGMSTFHIAHNLPKGAKVVTLDGAGLPFETATNQDGTCPQLPVVHARIYQRDARRKRPYYSALWRLDHLQSAYLSKTAPRLHGLTAGTHGRCASATACTR